MQQIFKVMENSVTPFREVYVSILCNTEDIIEMLKLSLELGGCWLGGGHFHTRLLNHITTFLSASVWCY